MCGHVGAWLRSLATDVAPRRHELFRRQSGRCNECWLEFPFRSLTVDYVISNADGGPACLDDLQLLFGACNGVKGDLDPAYLMARLREWAA